LIAFAAYFYSASGSPLVILTVMIGGLLGATVDSILGAILQGIYVCPRCEKETESYPEHFCGTRTVHVRGWRWLNNDLVNLICSLIGAGAALGGWYLLG
jgi:uncharacterized membrane protein